MSFSDPLELSVLDLVFGATAYTPPGTWYIGLSTTAPNDAGGNFSEPAGGNYSRKSVLNTGATFAAAANGQKTNNVDIDFPTANAGWGSIGWFGLFLASSGGVPQATGTLTLAKTVSAGDTFRIGSGKMIFTLD